jgi:hypothetical protein
VLTVKVGETAQFTCKATGDPAPNVRWAYGSETGPLRGDTMVDGGYLTMHDVTSAHEGEYFCIADNGQQRIVVPATLYVNREQPPTVRLTPATQTVRVGEPIKLRCVAEGQPVPRLEIVDSAGKSWSPVNGELAIASAERGHTGEYTCTATNAVGQVCTYVCMRVHWCTHTGGCTCNSHCRVTVMGGDHAEC